MYRLKEYVRIVFIYKHVYICVYVGCATHFCVEGRAKFLSVGIQNKFTQIQQICLYIYAYRYISIYIYTCMHMYMYLCVYICIYVCVCVLDVLLINQAVQEGVH